MRSANYRGGILNVLKPNASADEIHARDNQLDIIDETRVAHGLRSNLLLGLPAVLELHAEESLYQSNSRAVNVECTQLSMDTCAPLLRRQH